MFQLQNCEIRYSPYPLLVVKPAMEPSFYDELVRTFPQENLFGKIDKYDYKLSLSEKAAPENYAAFIKNTPSWNRFHAAVKSEAFIRSVVDFLKSRNLDPGVDEHLKSRSSQWVSGLKKMARGQPPTGAGRLKTRFEFSVLRADGGEVPPHTDTPRKIITIVMSMVGDGEWPQEFGGGLDINRPLDDNFAYNWNNRIVPWEKVEKIDTVPLVPNQCMIFLKTFNSLHSVRRMTQTGSKALRKTVTIVIERDH